MKKNLIKLSIAGALAIGFAGCANSGSGTSLDVPRVEKGKEARKQEIDPKIVEKVKAKGHDEFIMVLVDKRFITPFECKVAYNVAKNELKDKNGTNDVTIAKNVTKFMTTASDTLSKLLNVDISEFNCVKADRKVEEYKLGDLKKTQPEFYKLIKDVATQVHSIFKSREAFIDKNPALSPLKPENLDKFNIAIIKGYNHLTARYFPIGNIVFSGIDFDKLKKDKKYKTEVAFLIAHEMVHAYAMHNSEMLTKRAKMDVAVEVALNQAYKKLNPKMREMLDKAAAIIAKGLLTKADYDYDNKVMKERANSTQAKLLKGKKDKLEMIGVDLTIPQKTKLVLMDIISMNLDKPLQDSIKEAVSKLTSTDPKQLEVEAGAHAKNQEFEADALGMEAIKEMKLDPKDAISAFNDDLVKEANEHPTLSAHPKASDRVKKLKKEFNIK